MKKDIKSIFALFLILILSLSAAMFGQNKTNNLNPDTKTDAEQLKVLIEKIGRQVQKNLNSMFGVAFAESVRQQQLKADASPKGKPTNFIYESVVINTAHAKEIGAEDYRPIFTRTLKSIDGKPVEKQFPIEDSKCEETNPQTAYDNPLGFLLPKNQPDYLFSDGGETDFEGRKSIVILVAEKPVSEPLSIVEKDDCLLLSRPLRMKGEIWIDRETLDIVQIQWRQAETFSATIPKKVIKSGIISQVRPKTTISYDKQDFTIRFRAVKFQNPQQTLFLPYFSESVWLTGGVKLAGMRTTVEYTRYRLFNTNVELIDSDN